MSTGACRAHHSSLRGSGVPAVQAVMAVVLALLLLIGTGGAATATAAADPVHGNQTVPTYDYAQAVHESVKVQTSMDTDGDGSPDTVAVDIIRPATPAGTKVPVIMDASPYFTCCGRGNESQLKTYDSTGVIAQMPLYYDNYFVPRGYAEVGVDVLGTGRSTGCGDMGGPHEIASVVAAIRWLNGRAKATDLQGRAVTASWSSGAVAMIGKSYDGTLANGVAATGVSGLKTIVPISAIDSWYFYTRSSGVPYSDDYPSYLAGYVGRQDGVCDAQRRQLDADADDASGSYNAFWRARDYLRDADRVKASVFESHGVNDLNVQTDHLSTWWAALGAEGVTRKLWLSQEGHVDPFDYRRAAWVDALHRWFDNQLMGLDNGVLDEPGVTVETAPNQFETRPSWPSGSVRTKVRLGSDGLGSTTGGTLSVQDAPDLSETAAVDPSAGTVPGSAAGRILLTSAPLTSDSRLSGTPTVTLRIRSDRPETEVTAKLVDYGASRRPVGEGVRTLGTTSCWGQSGPVDSACFLDVAHAFEASTTSVLTRGWIDAAHSGSLTTPSPLVPGEWRTVTVPLRAQDVLLAKGHRLGLALTVSDTEWTTPHHTGATVAFQLGRSALFLPLTSALAIHPGTVPASATPRSASSPARTSPARTSPPVP